MIVELMDEWCHKPLVASVGEIGIASVAVEKKETGGAVLPSHGHDEEE